MNIGNKHLKESNFKDKFTNKLFPLNNISTEFTKTSNLLKNNYISYKNNHLNTNIQNKNTFNYLHDKKVFKNTKLFNSVKPTKFIKKRNYSSTLLNNNIVPTALTEGNLNNNQNQLLSLFHSNTLKVNNRNKKPKNSQYFSNNNKNNLDKIFPKSNSFKLIKKSKSNIAFIQQPKYFLVNKKEKQSINNNIIYSKIGQTNNITSKKIKNKSEFKKIMSLNTNKDNNNNSNSFNNNNKLSDSISKKDDEIKLIQKEIEDYKNEIINKDEIIKNQKEKINKLNDIFEKNQIILKNAQKKYEELKKEYNIMKNNYLLLKEKFMENEKSIKYFKKKELKLMQVLYLVKEKGIDINSILQDVNQITFHESSATNSAIQKYNNKEKSNNKVENNKNNDENKNNNEVEVENINNININSIEDNINNETEMSDLTVYFPDKIKMNNIMESKWGQNIPKLNFGYVPEYSSDSESQQNNNYDNTLMEEENMIFAKFNKFQNSV